jgi:hypothetical protein
MLPVIDLLMGGAAAYLLNTFLEKFGPVALQPAGEVYVHYKL